MLGCRVKAVVEQLKFYQGASGQSAGFQAVVAVEVIKITVKGAGCKRLCENSEDKKRGMYQHELVWCVFGVCREGRITSGC